MPLVNITPKERQRVDLGALPKCMQHIKRDLASRV
jgi:hypothetical protein